MLSSFSEYFETFTKSQRNFSDAKTAYLASNDAKMIDIEALNKKDISELSQVELCSLCEHERLGPSFLITEFGLSIAYTGAFIYWAKTKSLQTILKIIPPKKRTFGMMILAGNVVAVGYFLGLVAITYPLAAEQQCFRRLKKVNELSNKIEEIEIRTDELYQEIYLIKKMREIGVPEDLVTRVKENLSKNTSIMCQKKELVLSYLNNDSESKNNREQLDLDQLRLELKGEIEELNGVFNESRK